jgi:hypothetical protein
LPARHCCIEQVNFAGRNSAVHGDDKEHKPNEPTVAIECESTSAAVHILPS